MSIKWWGINLLVLTLAKWHLNPLVKQTPWCLMNLRNQSGHIFPCRGTLILAGPPRSSQHWIFPMTGKQLVVSVGGTVVCQGGDGKKNVPSKKEFRFWHGLCICIIFIYTCEYKYKYLELLTTIFKWMFGETTISQLKFGIIQLKQPFINGCLGFQVSMYMYVCACILLSSNHILTSFTPFHDQIFTLKGGLGGLDAKRRCSTPGCPATKKGYCWNFVELISPT